MTSFAYDYGILSDHTAYANIPTNLTEVFWNEEHSCLLSVCLEKDKVDVDKMSDYEKFRSFCNCVPLLKGHPVVSKVETLLSKICGVSISLLNDRCDDLWERGVEVLSKNQKSIGQLIVNAQGSYLQRILCDVASLETVQKIGVKPLLDGNSLLRTEVANWNDWENEMQSILERFIGCGCEGVVLTLDKDYQDVAPDPYHVNQALLSKENTVHYKSMLTAQVYRFLSLECATRRLFMILHFHCPKEQSMRFLARTQASAKLPKIIVTAPDFPTAEAILEFCVQHPKSRPECAIMISNYPSKPELSYALAFYAARYPLGRLFFITGHDFRNTAYESERIKDFSMISRISGVIPSLKGGIPSD